MKIVIKQLQKLLNIPLTIKKIGLSFLLLSYFSIADGKVITTSDLSDFRDYCEEETLVLFDMDDTLTDSPFYLGSGLWRQFIRSQIPAYEKIYGKKLPGKNLHDYLTFYLALKGPIQAVDEEFPTLIDELQTKGISPLVFTARGPEKWYSSNIKGVDSLTHTQLQSAGYHFEKSLPPTGFAQLDKEILDRGVLFANGIKKGPFLQQLIQMTGYTPKRVLFVDDKLDQILSVEKIMKELGIDYIGVWYRKAEDNHPSFSAAAATFQLEHFLNQKVLISNEEASQATEQFIEDSDLYFYDFLNRTDLTQLSIKSPAINKTFIKPF